jgi:hypothetical protein
MKSNLLFFALLGFLAVTTPSCNQSNDSKKMLDKIAETQLKAHLQDMADNPVTMALFNMGMPPTYSSNPIQKGNAFGRSILKLQAADTSIGYNYFLALKMNDTLWIGAKTYLDGNGISKDHHQFLFVRADAHMNFFETEMKPAEEEFIKAFYQSWVKGEVYEPKKSGQENTCDCDDEPDPASDVDENVKSI